MYSFIQELCRPCPFVFLPTFDFTDMIASRLGGKPLQSLSDQILSFLSVRPSTLQAMRQDIPGMRIIL